MTKDEFVAACLLLGFKQHPPGDPSVSSECIFLRAKDGAILPNDDDCSVSYTAASALGLTDDHSCSFENVLERLIPYVERKPQ